MPTYRVRAVHIDGVKLQDVEAADRQSIASAIGVAPQYVLEVQELSTSRRARIGARAATRRFPVRLFVQELAVLLNAGIPLIEAIEALREKEPSSAVAVMLDHLIEEVRQGQTLSHAMNTVEAFDPLLRAIVAANERSGQLSDALAQHARYLAWMEELRSRLIAACVYPAMLLLVGSAVILFLLLFVMPQFAGVLDGIHTDLPWASVVLIRVGKAAGQHPLLVAAVLAAFAGAMILVMRSPATRARTLKQLWHMPVIGERLKIIALARLYRSLGMLLSAGIPALTALKIVEEVMAGPWQSNVRAAAAEVGEGARLSTALESHQLATPVARRMVRVGEHSGEVPSMLEKAASFHDEEIARLAEFITRAVNPALMLVMGVIIGGIIVLMYLPIFQLVEQVQ